jgi:hypothetical protein
MRTKATIDELWRREVLPGVKRQYEQDGKPDYVARSESYNDFTDMLCKDGEISSHQYMTWTHPRECGR